MPLQTISNRMASGSNAPRGTLSVPISKFLTSASRHASVGVGLHLANSGKEVRSCFLRIRECSREEDLHSGFPLAVPEVCACMPGPFHPESTFLDSCKTDMQSLHRANRWVENPDLKIASEAYRMGIDWAVRNSHNMSIWIVITPLKRNERTPSSGGESIPQSGYFCTTTERQPSPVAAARRQFTTSRTLEPGIYQSVRSQTREVKLSATDPKVWRMPPGDCHSRRDLRETRPEPSPAVLPAQPQFDVRSVPW